MKVMNQILNHIVNTNVTALRFTWTFPRNVTFPGNVFQGIVFPGK